MQVSTDNVASSVAEPKYDFTSKGLKTLDLGFGSSRGNKKPPDRDSLSWEKMRKARILKLSIWINTVCPYLIDPFISAK